MFIEKYIATNINNIILIMFSLTFLLFIIVIIIIIKNIKLNKKINSILGPKKYRETKNLENIIKEYYNKFLVIEKNEENILKDINNIYEKLKNCVQKIAMERYNPFDNMGGDLSYVLAILDECNNGFVINTIFNRENSITYCKPIENGISTYKLSYEEECVIKKAMGIKKKIRGKKNKDK